jgi:hypothetical protein
VRLAGWDLLPPGSKGYEFDNFTYAGYHQSPMKWAVGTTPVPIGWAAGIQYDGDTVRATQVLKNLSTFYPAPAAKCYEIAGFFWWQVRPPAPALAVGVIFCASVIFFSLNAYFVPTPVARATRTRVIWAFRRTTRRTWPRSSRRCVCSTTRRRPR